MAGSAVIDGRTRAAGLLSHVRRHADAAHLVDKAPCVHGDNYVGIGPLFALSGLPKTLTGA